ncbi:MAG: bifunctional phosphoribosylaminoimidazolecarboxamide formyltransferase/inosine monophosphate cyclohydrolase [Thiotrichales bacterium]|nr:MAG: bifunctional phosphoribosylaminoimidazolecarboxamide formyltransferase/inosine monophosphate cyclohydrolase [Thiotrichales bacterium]
MAIAINQNITKVKTALLSVSDKTGIVEFAKKLKEFGVHIISTGGTAKALQDAGIDIQYVADVTGFPEIMHGRVKTLHPKVHAGILGCRTTHDSEAKQHDVDWIDLVVCNLYPFADTIKTTNDVSKIVEKIDIGGPTMTRAAAKNFSWVTVVTTPSDYDLLIKELTEHQGVSFATRKSLSLKAFTHTASYDAAIVNFFNQETFPENIILSFNKLNALRYGENPTQKACVYVRSDVSQNTDYLLNAKQLQGKQLSYNNLLDANAAVQCISEFHTPCSVVVKHNNPCGVAIADNIEEAFICAWRADSKSAFGSVVALNAECSGKVAEELATRFIEIVIAPKFSADAINILSKKKNLRLLELAVNNISQKLDLKFLENGLLLQEADTSIITNEQLNCVTKLKPSKEQLKAMLFAWKVTKYVKSNAIVISNDTMSYGIGAGQVSRIDAVDIAIHKANALQKESPTDNLILASDAFFPFKDSIETIAKNAKITAIIQPGGSIRDQEVIETCDALNIAMCFTGTRCFRH